MQLAGKNSHHIIEATFKAFARALRQATEYDPRRRGTVPRFVLMHSSIECIVICDICAILAILKNSILVNIK